MRRHIPTSRTDVSDEFLVRQCLSGHEEAWALLIQKYKNLIYSIPFRYDCSPEDAADVFQSVCLDLYSDLHSLRKVESLRAWIIRITVNRSLQSKQKRQRLREREGIEINEEITETSPAPSSDVECELEREQKVREAVEKLPDRCKEMVRVLFYEQPPIPYEELAARLGLATGSIGFIRGRCLKRLEKILKEMGL